MTTFIRGCIFKTMEGGTGKESRGYLKLTANTAKDLRKNNDRNNLPTQN